MESNLSGDRIKSYSINFAERVSDNFFRNKLRISGKEILTVTPEKQVNLFILKNLFKIWEQESEKLKSNYFDYESEEVKAAMENFLNVLSQNISIPRADFEPLLIQSVFDSLLLILSPYDYYRMEIGSNAKINLQQLKRTSKYILINKNLLNAFILKMELKDIPELDTKNALFLFDQVCEQSNESPDDVDEHFRLLSEIKPLKADDFYTKEDSFKPTEERREQEIKKEQEVSQKKILAETFLVNTPTLNEKFGTESNSSLAEKLQRSKIQSLKSSIPINQKFVYINNLFDGNIQDFAEAVDKIDECKDVNEADALIKNFLLPKYKWNINDESYLDFVQVVERKFL